MDLVPWRSTCAMLPRNGLFALAVALAAILLPAPGAFGQEQLPNQGEITKALNELTAAEAQAHENVPANPRVKSAEDALDAAKRANMDAAAALEAAQKVQEAANNEANAKKTEEAQKTADLAADTERTAQTRADRVREELKDRTSKEQKDRAAKYREALDQRRAARKKLQSLHAEVEGWLGRRRRGIGGTKELEGPIIDLKKRIEESLLPIAPRFISALAPFRSLTSNVSTDAQTFCTYGDARPTPVALEPSDADGNPLKEKLDPALARAIALAVGKPLTTINISNPDGAPQGQAQENTPKGPPPSKTAVPGPTSTEKPPAQPVVSAPADPLAGKPSPDSTTSTRPKHPEHIVTDTKLPNGEAANDAIDRLAKVADEAQARGDMTTFEMYRDAAVTMARWLASYDNGYSSPLPARGDNSTTPLDDFLKENLLNSVKAWDDHANALEGWKPSPGAAASATSSAMPKRPADTGLLGVKLDGEFPENAIDRFSKLAEEALARGDKEDFARYREELRKAAQWVSDKTRLADRYSVVLGGAGGIRQQWQTYVNEISGWRSEIPAATTPGATAGKPAATAAADAAPGATAPPAGPPTGAAAGQPTDTPAPGSSPAATPKPVATPPRTAEPGPKSVPAPGKSASDEKPEIGSKTPPSLAVPASQATPTVNITIHFKATEAALQGEPQGSEYKAALMKLTAPEPELPKAGRTKTAKTALDRGHDRSPVTCVAGASGQCKAQLTAEDREAYQLGDALYRAVSATADGKTTFGVEPIEHLRVDVATKKSTGAVIQKSAARLTPAQLAALEAPAGVQITKTAFKIGDKAFTRVSFGGPEAATAAAAKKFADAFGADAQIDSCGDKAPGPPLGMEPASFSALNQELPQTTLSIRQRMSTASARW